MEKVNDTKGLAIKTISNVINNEDIAGTKLTPEQTKKIFDIRKQLKPDP